MENKVNGIIIKLIEVCDLMKLAYDENNTIEDIKNYLLNLYNDHSKNIIDDFKHDKVDPLIVKVLEKNQKNRELTPEELKFLDVKLKYDVNSMLDLVTSNLYKKDINSFETKFETKKDFFECSKKYLDYILKELNKLNVTY